MQLFNISARLDIDTVATLDGLAARRACSRAEAIRQLARAYREQRLALHPAPEHEVAA